MADKRRAIVTARFEILASSAPSLEAMLADLTKQVSCTLMEVSTNAESPVLASGTEDPIEPAGAGAESPGLDAENLGLEDRPEPIWGISDDGEAGTVLREEERPVVDVEQEAPVATGTDDSPVADSADSGAREETSGDSLIVPTKEN